MMDIALSMKNDFSIIEVGMNKDNTSAGEPDQCVETVLLLHGATATHDIWEPLLPMFSSRCRVVALPLPGHLDGEAVDISRPVSIDLLAEQIIETMRELGIERAHVAGNSLGGWLALELARKEFAVSVTAFSPAGSWPDEKTFAKVARAIRLICRAAPYLYVFLMPFMRYPSMRKLLLRGQMQYGERVSFSSVRRMLLGAGCCPVVPPLIETFANGGSLNPLEDKGIPIHIIWSEADAVLPPSVFLPQMQQKIPFARYSMLAEAGHVPMYDQPAVMVEHIERSIWVSMS